MVGVLREHAALPPGGSEVEPPPGLAAFDGLVERHRSAGLRVTTEISGAQRPLPPGLDRGAYRILQEALTNAARHGDGSAEVELAYRPDALEVSVANRLPREPANHTGGGHGVIGMRERAALLGGSLEAGPAERALSAARAVALLRQAGMTPRVKVLIVDDDALMRAGLRGVLASDEGIELVGEADDGRQAAYRTRLLEPDVVVMDVRMPDLDGISATREVLEAFPDVKVVILTTFEQDDYIFGALSAGASGFLLKRTRPEELIAAIHTIAAGDSLLSPSVTSRVIEQMAGLPAPDAARDPRLEELTAREREVLEHVARGLSNAEIAAALVIEESTVKTHVKRILAKLAARDRVQAVIFAYETGLIRPG